MATAIAFDKVTKQYRSTIAIDNLSLEVETGTVVALLGPNGAGKTTTISMMLGLTQPTKGQVRVFGKDPAVAANRVHSGAMLQSTTMPDKASTRELIELFRTYYPDPLSTAELLHMAGLDKEADHPAKKLSGGQQRRLQFALAMAGDPRILFLDEPTTGMDVESRRVFWAQLQSFARNDGRTILLTTHHLEEADAIADRIVVIHHGRTIADASPAELKSLTGSRFISCMAGPSLTEGACDILPGVIDVSVSGRHIRIRTSDSDTTLRALIGLGLDVHDIEVTSGGLEDAFVALTQPIQEAI